jgi:hypothetical protein
MIPFFQYFNIKNINKSVSVPYQGIAPIVEYVESDFSLLDKNIYGLDSFYIYQPSGEVSIQAESAAAAAESVEISSIPSSTVSSGTSTTVSSVLNPASENSGGFESWNGDIFP